MSATIERSDLAAKASTFEAELGALGDALARTADTPDWVLDRVRGQIRLIETKAMPPPDDIDPYFVVALQHAALRAQDALSQGDPERRDLLRVAIEQWRQVFRDIAGSTPVSETQPVDEVVRWMQGTLGVSVGELADLVGVSPRSFQRWASGESSPRPDEERRLRLIAHVALNLRHVLTGPGVVRWFREPRRDLNGRPPAELLEEAGDAPRLLMLATSARSMRAT